jgi:hypothetical protein
MTHPTLAEGDPALVADDAPTGADGPPINSGRRTEDA